MEVLEYKNGNQQAVLLLHEIYGMNQHMEEVCNYYSSMGYDVYCPNMIERKMAFDYSQGEEAYHYFMKNIGFNVAGQISDLITQLKLSYERVILIGYSIGATVAWICSANPMCDKVIGFYGSRIREYIEITPSCPILLLFASEDSFDVISVAESLREYDNVSVKILEGHHGFMDPYNEHYDANARLNALQIADRFME
jgi:Dienelactone hydrolase and related enzymes